MRRVVAVGLGVAMLLASAGDGEAQRRRGNRNAPDSRGPAGYFSITGIAADPVGDLGLFFDKGFGAELTGGIPVAADGHLRARITLGFLNYGIERQSFCFSLPIGCRVGVDLTTSNNIFFGGVGPEIVLAQGPVEPYVFGTGGFAAFVTSSSIGGHDDHGGDFGTTTHLSDGMFAWTVGGGVRIRIAGGRKPVSVDLGVERHENGVADFLTEGDILDHPDGSITIFPNRSEANLVTFKVGFSIGVPSRSGGRS